MKSLRCRATRVLAAGILCFCSLCAWGQGENPPASTRESGATSGHGMTALEQSYKQAVEDQIKAAHAERWQEALKNDASFFEKDLASPYFGISADGRMRTKATTIESFKSGVLKYEAFKESDVAVKMYGDAAVVSSIASIKASIQNKPIDGDYRATSVYVRDGGTWREVAFELSPVTKGS